MEPTTTSVEATTPGTNFNRVISHTQVKSLQSKASNSTVPLIEKSPAPTVLEEFNQRVTSKMKSSAEFQTGKIVDRFA